MESPRLDRNMLLCVLMYFNKEKLGSLTETFISEARKVSGLWRLGSGPETSCVFAMTSDQMKRA